MDGLVKRTAPLRFETREVPGQEEALEAVLILPTATIEVGRERLRISRPRSSSADNAIVDAVRARPAAAMTIFCAQPGDGGSWGFAPDLDREETEALAEHLIRSQLLTLRRLFLEGICMHVRIDFGGIEQSALGRAAQSVRYDCVSRLGTHKGIHKELAELDIWLLGSFVFFFSVPVDRLFAELFVSNADVILNRRAHAERTLRTLSSELRRQLEYDPGFALPLGSRV